MQIDEQKYQWIKQLKIILANKAIINHEQIGQKIRTNLRKQQKE